MQVVATKQGFDGIQVREAGQEFTAPLGLPDKQGKRAPIAQASWYKPVSESKSASESKGGKDDLV